MKPQPMVDSAIFYFKIAQEKAGARTRSSPAPTRMPPTTWRICTQSAGDNANAIVEYRKYLAIDSD